MPRNGLHEEAVRAILRRQSGIITVKQAKAAGLTRAQVRYRESSGQWERVHHGVYRHATIGPSYRGSLWLGVLAAGGVVSHRSAAVAHGFGELGHRPVRPEVSVRHGYWREVAGVVVHQSTQIAKLDVTTIDGLPTTGRGRTVLDLGASTRPGRLGKTVDELVRKNLITLGELWDVLIRHSVQGRNGCGPLRVVLEERLGQERLALSDWSYAVANLLESAGLERPRLEFRAHDTNGRFLAQIDLAYPQSRLAIELDSVGFHNNLKSFHSDRSRARGLTVEGWSVLQFTWKDYTQDSTGLVRQVRGILSRDMAA